MHHAYERMLHDSNGKAKFHDAQQRNKVLTAAFVVGLCIGLVASQRIYLAINKADILADVSAPQQTAGGAVGTHSSRSKSSSTSSTQSSRSSSSNGSDSSISSDVGKAMLSDPSLAPLRKKLLAVAPDKEVLVGVSNMRPLQEGMLETFLQGVKQAGVSNYIIVALDQQTEDALTQRGYNSIYMPIQISASQKDTGENHAVSALKFGILRKFLLLGWNVLLSDIDIAVLQNPFKHLHRDSDVEGMSDGYDKITAYGAIDGFDDPSMGWARFAQQYKHFNLNSGLFYLRANARTIDLMTRLETRLSKEKYWDQSAYNEEIFHLSHDDYKSPQVTVRVMGIYKFMNSKVLFKDVRTRPVAQQPGMPVMVHINYHPNKHERMKAVFKYYLEGDKEALRSFPGGSEPGSR